MTPVQKKLLIMLEEIIGICERYGIVYYAAGGTALGAIRHGGFIPWDDDVDIMMPRDDWKRFVEIAPSILPANRVLCCLDLDENYPHVFGRYTDTETCAIHYNHLLGGAPEGLVIDIFILDYVPDNGPSFLAHRETLALYNDLANPLGYSYPMSSSAAKLKRYTRRISKEGRRAVLEELASRVGCYEKAEGEYLVMRWAAAPRLFHKSIFGFPRQERFEHLSISVPARLNDYLVQHYGDDWPQLPSDAGRATHDAITFTDVSFQDVFDDYLPFVNIEKTQKAILRRRQYHIDHMDELHKAEDIRARIQASFTEEAIRRRVYGEREIAIGHLIAKGPSLGKRCFTGEFFASNGHDSASDSPTGEFPSQDAFALTGDALLGQCASLRDELDSDCQDGRFEVFYRIQSSPDLAGREEYLSIRRYYDPIGIRLADGNLIEAVCCLVDTNRMGQAARILRSQELSGVADFREVNVAKDYLEAIRLPRSLADVGCVDEALELSRYLLMRFPGNFSNRLFYLEALRRRGDWGKLREAAYEGLRLFPMSGEFEKYAADADRRLEVYDDTALCKRYAKALSRTTNAFIHRDVLSTIAQLEVTKCSPEVNSALQQGGAHSDWQERLVSRACETARKGSPNQTANVHRGQQATQSSWLCLADQARQAIPGELLNWELGEAGSRAIRLLQELVGLCSRLGISHFLGPMSCRVALALSDCDRVPVPELDLMVPGNCMAQIAKALLESVPEGRAIDCWLTNGKYPLFAIDYVDKATTFLQFDEGTDVGAPGVRVRIVPIRQVSTRRDEKLARLERGWELNGYKLAKSLNKKKAIAAARARAFMLVGRRRAAKTLFERCANASNMAPQLIPYGIEGNLTVDRAKEAQAKTGATIGQNAEKMAVAATTEMGAASTINIKPPAEAKRAASKLSIHVANHGVRTCEAGHFAGITTLELGGVAYPAPVDVEAFLDAMWGSDWRLATSAFLEQYRSALVCACLPYEEFLQELRNRGCAIEKLFGIMRKIRFGMLPLANDLRIRKRMMLIAERSRDRKLLCDELDARWPEIEKALADRDDAELVHIYASYEAKAKQYLAAGLGLCPSKRHLDVLCYLLRGKGEDADASELERRAPESHYAPLGKDRGRRRLHRVENEATQLRVAN